MDGAGLPGNRNARVPWHRSSPGFCLVPEETQMLVRCQINLGIISSPLIFVDISHKSLEVEL